jgi:hypothetical protein
VVHRNRLSLLTEHIGAVNDIATHNVSNNVTNNEPRPPQLLSPTQLRQFIADGILRRAPEMGAQGAHLIPLGLSLTFFERLA